VVVKARNGAGQKHATYSPPNKDEGGVHLQGKKKGGVGNGTVR